MIWPTYEAVFGLAQPLIKQAEGFRALPYKRQGDKATIGWGTTRYPDGRAVTLSDLPISMAEGQVYLEAAAKLVFASLQRPGIITRSPTDHQAAALLSLGYNIGVGVHDGVKGDLADSTLLDRFNAGDIAGAADQFLAWDKAHDEDGHVITLAGLDVRRHAERSLFLTPDAPALRAQVA